MDTLTIAEQADLAGLDYSLAHYRKLASNIAKERRALLHKGRMRKLAKRGREGA